MDNFDTRKCPKCKKRVLDATSGSSGKVRLKCMHCKQLADLILSLFGSFSVTDLPMSFRDTQNSMELFMYYLMDALTVVDDFHPTKAQDKAKQEAQFQSMCRLIGNRSARGRLNSNCEYRTDRVPKSAREYNAPRLSYRAVPKVP